MTQVVGMVRRSDFEAAIEAARNAGVAVPLTGMAASVGRTAMAHVEKAWDAIEHALRCAFEQGADAARTLIDEAVAGATQLVVGATRGGRDLHDALLERMQTYLADFVERAVASVRATISVGGRDLALRSVQVQQSISMTGSLKLSIEELCGLTGAGQLTLVAQYEMPSV